MSTEPAVLLRRSDGPFYRVHIGHDYEAVAGVLCAQQAFAVSPILIGPRSSLDAANLVNKAIQTLCTPLKNSWFQAPSIEIATIVLLHASRSTLDPEAEDMHGEIPNSTESTPDPKVDNKQAEASCNTRDLDATLWNYVGPCSSKDASKAAEIRTVLIQKLGKTEGKRILNHCVATVARNSHGQKNRVLKANGKLLKLKQ